MTATILVHEPEVIDFIPQSMNLKKALSSTFFVEPLINLNGVVVRRDGVVVRASASQSVDLGFIPLVESYQKTLKNGIYSFPAWRSAFMG